MKVYMYRNHLTGMEVKVNEERPIENNYSGHYDQVSQGYKLMKIIDLSVSDKERKAK